MHETHITDRNGFDLVVYTLTPEGEPKGIVQIVHGAGEHALRYLSFAESLVKEGFIVVLHDQHSHGKSRLPNEEVIHFADHDGHTLLLNGAYEIYLYATSINPNLPVFVVAHSMGSIVVRALMSEHRDLYQGIILIGSPITPPMKIRFGRSLAKCLKQFKGPRHISPLITKMSQDKPYLMMKRSGLINDRHEWVTTDETKQKELQNDPLIGKPFTISAQIDVLNLMLKAQSYRDLRHFASSRLMVIFCGGEDALCDYGEAARKLYLFYDRAGFTNLNYKVYANMRHELLNEIDRHIVINDIVQILNKETH